MDGRDETARLANSARNYLTIKSQVLRELRGSMSDLELLAEANRRFQALADAGVDHRPVDAEEARAIFAQYYGDQDARAAQDRERVRRGRVLSPGAADSYKYRPRPGARRSGPEVYDMRSVDDGAPDSRLSAQLAPRPRRARSKRRI